MTLPVFSYCRVQRPLLPTEKNKVSHGPDGRTFNLMTFLTAFPLLKIEGSCVSIPNCSCTYLYCIHGNLLHNLSWIFYNSICPLQKPRYFTLISFTFRISIWMPLGLLVIKKKDLQEQEPCRYKVHINPILITSYKISRQ